MNTLIKKELDSIQLEYSDTLLEICIPKADNKISNTNTSSKEFVVGHDFIIKLKDYIVHPYENFTLHTQWNKGVVPQEYTYKVKVIQVMGKMIRVDGVGCENNSLWSGWLPKSSVEIIEVL